MLLTKIGIPREFCAIDASTLSMAYAYYRNGELNDYGKVAFSGANIHEKIASCAIEAYEFFQGHPTKVILVEQVVYINSPKTMADLSRAQGALLGAAALSGVKEVRTVPPIVWQGFIGNPRLTAGEKQAIKVHHPDKKPAWYKNEERRIRKQRTIAIVNKKYGIEVDDDDIADAIGVGCYGISQWSHTSV